MLLDVTSDQDFLRATTGRFLSDQVPPDEVRRMRHDAAGFGDDYWARGADLGWTSLLVSESRGGGSVSARGLVDLTLIAYEFGRHAAPGPLLDTNVVAAALTASDADAHQEVLGDLVAGIAVAAWCYAEPAPADRLGAGTLEIAVAPDGVVVHGVKRPVESAGQAAHFLVTGRTGEGVTQVLVPADAVGVSLKPLHAIDVTRRFWEVTFDEVRVPRRALVGDAGDAAEQVERQVQVAAVISTAESVGAMERAFDMTLEWAFDRYSFGRPLASYQALKHRFAYMKSWLEASHAIGDAAALAVADGAPEAAELASAAKAFVGDHGTELAQDCVQLHGGIGVTYEHDLHLFLRRITLNRSLQGCPADHRQRIATIAEQREDAA
jgi:alkylation response protein AidB-like acyl-CoA dehydrogenase